MTTIASTRITVIGGVDTHADVHVELTELTKFSHATYTWGLEEHTTTLNDHGDGAATIVLPPRPHPIPPGSTTVEFAFTKHPEGRLVTITHHDVPTYLAADIEALWRIVLDGHKANKYPSWPWHRSPPEPAQG